MSEIVENFIVTEDFETGLIVRGINNNDNFNSNDLMIVVSLYDDNCRVLKIDSLKDDFNFTKEHIEYGIVKKLDVTSYSLEMWKKDTGRDVDIELIRKYTKEDCGIDIFCIHKDVAMPEEHIIAHSVIKDISHVYEITDEERCILMDEITEVLTRYGYYPDTFAVNEILDGWIKNKGYLINMFKEHPNYNGKFQIAFSKDFSRKVDKEALLRFNNWLNSYSVRQLYKTDLHWDVFNIISSFLRGDDTDQTVPEMFADGINNLLPDAKIVVGMKTSRALNKILGLIDVTKHSEYNREFAKCSDALNPLIIKRHTVLSVHPVDYLLMSNGNSWSSCHMIGKGDSGCYSGGTLSYMLDRVSMVFYTVDALAPEDNLELEKKINRCMFFYDNKRLVQSRLYPQSCDYGYRDMYDDIRHIVQKIITNCLDVPNLWKLKRGIKACKNAIISKGVQYQDWCHFSNVNISVLKEFSDEVFEKIIVGEKPICPECGNTHNHSGSILCDNCYDNYEDYDDNYITCPICGEEIHEDEAYYSEETNLYYCGSCVTYCNYHDTYEVSNDHTFYVCNFNVYCEKAVEDADYLFFCSECGELINIRRNGDAIILGDKVYCNEFCVENSGLVKVMTDNENHEWVNPELVEVYTCPICLENYLEDKFNTEGDMCLNCLSTILKEKLAVAS